MGKRLTIGLAFPEGTSILEMYELAKDNRIIKVIDSGIFSKNSNPTEFGRMLCHLWSVDEVQFTAPYVPMSKSTVPWSIAYTVPRTGTHVVAEVHHTNGYVHAGAWETISEPLLEEILTYQCIVGVSRKNLVDTICSREITRITPGVMLTTNMSYSLQSNKAVVRTLRPFSVDLNKVNEYLEEMANYYSQLLALKIMFGKHVSFSLLDDLAVRKDLNSVKNPYRHQDLISNYTELVDFVNTKYQPAYDFMTNQVIRHCGLSLSGIQFPSINDFS